MSAKRSTVCAGLLVIGFAFATPVWPWDPLMTARGLPTSPAANLLATDSRVCAFDALPIPLRLNDAIERALCNHPQTQQAWANVKAQAAAVGHGRAAYLPTLDANWQRVKDTTHQQILGHAQYDSDYKARIDTASVSLNWVLYDFGGRAAALQSATQGLAAARANQLATLQTVFASVAVDFYAAQAAHGALTAAREVEHTAQRSAQVATARVDRGVAPIGDQLQAQTAHAAAIVSRTQAEREWAIAVGKLASDMNLAPTTNLALPDVDDGAQPGHEFGASVEALIEEAQRRYPGVAAAKAQVDAARANAAQVRAQGLPRLSLVGQYQFNNQPASLQFGFPAFPATRREWYVGLRLTIPLFEGFSRTYQARQADAQTEVQIGKLAEARQQLGFDVWNSFQQLQAATKNLDNSVNLLALAVRSLEVAQRRYQTGVGGILESLHAQSALSNAKQQRIRALTDWRSARLRLASRLGRLDMASVPAS